MNANARFFGVGRLTADPELRQTPSVVDVTTIRVAFPGEYSKEKEGTEDLFISVEAWRGTAKFICEQFQKGKPILVSGFLRSRSRETREGAKYTDYYILADSAGFVPGVQAGVSQAGQKQTAGRPAPASAPAFPANFSPFQAAAPAAPPQGYPAPAAVPAQQPAPGNPVPGAPMQFSPEVLAAMQQYGLFPKSA